MNISDEIKIEKASIEDIEEIYALEQICFDEDAFSKKQFIYLVKKSKSEFVAVRKGGKIIGYLIVLKRKNSKYYRIYSIATDPKARGLGVAKALLEYVDKISEKNSIQRISLEVKENNEIAINLYKKQGYQIVDKKMNYYADGSTALIAIKEVKNLSKKY